MKKIVPDVVKTYEKSVAPFKKIKGCLDFVSAKFRILTEFAEKRILFGQDAPDATVSNKGTVLALLIFAWIICAGCYKFTVFLTTVSYANPFGALSALFGGIVMLWLLWIVVCDVWGVIAINQQHSFRLGVSELVEKGDADHLKRFLTTCPVMTSDDRSALDKAFEKESETGKVLKAFNKTVLAKYDAQIDKVIKDYAAKSAVANSISSKAWLDFAITFFCYVKTVIEIAKIYHIKIGVCTLLRLLGLGFGGLSAATILQNLVVESTKKTKIGSVLPEAVINATAVYKFGHWVKDALRPVNPKYK